MPNLSSGPVCELSTGLQLQQKDQNHTAISDCFLTRSQVGVKGVVIPPQNFPIRFPQSGAKIRANCKFCSPKAQGSHMPLVRAVYHDLLRRVAARSNHRRNDGGQGAQLPGRRKVLTTSQVLSSIQYICFRKT